MTRPDATSSPATRIAVPTASAEPDRRRPRVLVVVAHPDDETFGCGAAIAHAVGEGAEVVVCSATAGEQGEDLSGGPSHDLARRRTAELAAAGAALGVGRTTVLGFGDSGWDGEPAPGSLCAVPFTDVVRAVAGLLGELVPDVVVTMDPAGSDGHRDHARIGAATTVATRQLAGAGAPVRLYHWFLPRSLMDDWARHMASLDPDSVYLGTEMGRPDADTTTVLDARRHVARVRRAIVRHASQRSPYEGIPGELEEAFLGTSHLRRVIPAWRGGPPETSLFG